MPDNNNKTGLGMSVGELAVKHALITRADLEKAASICADLENSHDAIPEYLVAQNLISESDRERLITVAKAMNARNRDIMFGNIAIRRGFITQSILDLALDEQTTLFRNRKKYTLLGDILVDAGMLTPQQRNLILAEQNRNDTGEDGGVKSDKRYDETDGISFMSEAVETNTSSSATPADSQNKNFALSEIFPCGIRLIIKGDGNSAYLFKTEGFDKDISIGQIKELLASRNIIHGIVDNSLIIKFIDSDIFFKKPFKIAEGNAPVDGQNASIQYFFTKNRLKAGTIREDGTIDFRERGNIPQVQKGAVLAVKKNAVEGQVGKNIFNDTIRVLPARDVRLKTGKGTILSEDRLKVIAAVSGHPKLGSDGTIYVYDTFVVDKDVDFQTGNIDYQGDVTVRGCIQNGFTVKGHNIRASEIDGATVIAQGNVVVDQGINESTISSQGTLTAKFIQNSTISCAGDVISEKEVVESKIECSGSCTIKGVIIYSKIAAKMGLNAKQIGMEKAPPSTITVGVDTFAESALGRLRAEIENGRVAEKSLNETISSLNGEIVETESKILRLISIKERHEDERMDLLSEISSLNGRRDAERLKHLQTELERVVRNIAETGRKISSCHDNIHNMREKLSDAERSLQESLKRRKEFIDEKNGLTEWMDKNPGIAMVKVEGKVMAGTRVYGRHSEETVRASVKAVVIKEDHVSRLGRDGESNLWKIYITKM